MWSKSAGKPGLPCMAIAAVSATFAARVYDGGHNARITALHLIATLNMRCSIRTKAQAFDSEQVTRGFYHRPASARPLLRHGLAALIFLRTALRRRAIKPGGNACHLTASFPEET